MFFSCCGAVASSGLPARMALAMHGAASHRNPPSMASVPAFRPTRFTKSNPDGRAPATTAAIEQPKATGAESTIEYALFGIFGTVILLAIFALFTIYSPRHRKVPNRLAEGLRQDRVNILLFGIGGENHPQHDQLADS